MESNEYVKDWAQRIVSQGLGISRNSASEIWEPNGVRMHPLVLITELI